MNGIPGSNPTSTLACWENRTIGLPKANLDEPLSIIYTAPDVPATNGFCWVVRSQRVLQLSATVMRLGMLDFNRVGKPEALDKLLLGIWRTVATMPSTPGRHGYYYFRRDGRETFFIPFLTERCSYSISGDRIRLTNRQGSKEGPIQWDGRILTVPWGRGDAGFERF